MLSLSSFLEIFLCVEIMEMLFYNILFKIVDGFAFYIRFSIPWGWFCFVCCEKRGFFFSYEDKQLSQCSKMEHVPFSSYASNHFCHIANIHTCIWFHFSICLSALMSYCPNGYSFLMCSKLGLHYRRPVTRLLAWMWFSPCSWEDSYWVIGLVLGQVRLALYHS